MIYLQLLIGFLKVGCFSFGGAYGAIPLIRDVVLSYGWLSEEELTYMIAVSESTPGPIMVNLATYIGSSQAGFPGALLATLVVVLPAFAVILLVMAVFNALIKNKYFEAVIRGLKPCMIGMILATGIHIVISGCFGFGCDVRAIVIALVIIAFSVFGRVITKKKISPILTIAVSAALGITVYGF